jgi:hypothetical protein
MGQDEIVKSRGNEKVNFSLSQRPAAFFGLIRVSLLILLCEINSNKCDLERLPAGPRQRCETYTQRIQSLQTIAPDWLLSFRWSVNLELK